MLEYFGYSELHGNGSRRKFIHVNYPVIILHEPHPRNTLKMYQIGQVLQILEEEKLI